MSPLIFPLRLYFFSVFCFAIWDIYGFFLVALWLDFFLLVGGRQVCAVHNGDLCALKRLIFGGLWQRGSFLCGDVRRCSWQTSRGGWHRLGGNMKIRTFSLCLSPLPRVYPCMLVYMYVHVLCWTPVQNSSCLTTWQKTLLLSFPLCWLSFWISLFYFAVFSFSLCVFKVKYWIHKVSYQLMSYCLQYFLIAYNTNVLQMLF